MPPMNDHLHERTSKTITNNAGAKSPRSRTKPLKNTHNILGAQRRKKSNKAMVTFTMGSIWNH